MSTGLLGLLVAATLTRPPALLTAPPLTSPDPRQDRSVLMEITIDETGAVNEATVLESGGEDFDRAARAMILAFRFQAAEVDGAPAPVRIHYRLRFPRTAAGVRGSVHGLEGPLGGAEVRCAVSSTRAATVHTSSTGAFLCDGLAAGRVDLELSAPGYLGVSTQVELEAGALYTLSATLAPAVLTAPLPVQRGPEVVVRAARRRRSGELSLANQETRALPGTGGDPIKSVELMPAVARTPAGTSALIVWGAAEGETLSFVDGAPIPWLFHLGGQRSVLPASLVERVRLVPAAFGAEHGRAVGGILSAETRALSPEVMRLEVSADFLDGAASVEVPLARGGAFISMRQGWMDRLASAIAPQAAQHALLPEYRDLSVATTLSLDEDTRLAALVVAADDGAILRGYSDDPGLESTDLRHRSFVLATVGATRGPRDRASDLRGSISWQQESRTLSIAGAASTLDEEVLRATVRAAHRARIRSGMTLELGLDGQAENAEEARDGTLTQPPLEGDRSVFGAPGGDRVNLDRWRVTTISLSPFASMEIRLGPVLLEPSLRADLLGLDLSRATPKIGATPEVGSGRFFARLAPRVAGRLELWERLRLHAAAGLYSQGPAPATLSAVFGNPKLGLVDSFHATGGIELELPWTLVLTVDAFFRRSSGLAARSSDANPGLAAALLDTGQGRARGAQASLHIDHESGLFGWLSYTLSKSERRDGPSSEWRRFDFDQTHQLSILAGLRWEAWTFSARARLASGFPRTPVVGHYTDLLRGLEIPILGALGASELPSTFQLDAHADRRFLFSEAELDVSLDLLNVTGQRNPEEIVYSADFSQHAYATGLGFLAVLGLRVVL